MKMYRQGDILLVAEKKNIREEYEISKNKIVAYGEATGHKHEFEGNVSLMTSTSWRTMGTMYAEVKEESKLVHDEHDTIVIPEGFYRVVRQREYDGENIRQVVD